MRRRKFIKCMGHSMAIPGVMSSLGLGTANAQMVQQFMRMAAEQEKALVLIFLDGGNDGLNTVIPLDRLSELNDVRPHVVLPDSSLIELPQSQVALHPALDGFASLFGESRLGIVQNVGYPEQNYSHFRSSDIWMSGSDSDEVINSGWMGRYLAESFEGYPDEFPNAEMPDPLSIEIGYGSSLLFQGPNALMSMVLSDVGSFYELLEETEIAAPNTPAGDKLKYVRLIARQSQQYGEAVTNAADKAGNQLVYPGDADHPEGENGDHLAQKLKIIARLISGGLKTPIYMVRIGGFDTHEGQVEAGETTTGFHNELLKELNDAVVAFMKDLDHLGLSDQVMGMTFSEFGRRIVSNASNGTDHGAAAPLFVFGNSVAGGVLGENPIIDSSMNYENNLEMQYDFRQVYASVLEQWFGADSVKINSVLYKDFDTIPIIGQDVITAIPKGANQTLNVYPNPLNGRATIEFNANASMLNVEVIDINGRLVERVYRGQPSQQKISINWNTSNLQKGRYFVIVNQQDNRQVFSVVKS